MEEVWSERERGAWTPPEDLKPSEWSPKYRVLSRRQSSRPGRWRNENAPALVGVMDLAVRKSVKEIWVKKAAQVGASEAIRNVIGCIAHLHPDPMLIVLPDEKTGKKIVRKRLLPLFEDTQVLAALGGRMSRDKQLTQITLQNGFDLNVAWSGSPTSLASDQFCTVYLDEPDKYDRTHAEEAPPAELARVRTRTYGDRGRIIGTCTPTTVDGTISVEFEACPEDAKFYFFVPCPHCGLFQRLLPDRIKWEKFPDEKLAAKDLAARVKRRGLAWYECAAVDCAKRIHDHQKPAMLFAGYWGNEPATVPSGREPFEYFVDGSEAGDFPESDKIGLHYPATIDLSATFCDIAAEWIRAERNPGKIRQLRNSTLAETYESTITRTSSTVFAKKTERAAASGYAPLVVPKWAMVLLMSIDTQLDHFYFTIRAYGHAFRSRRIHHGRVLTFEELTILSDQRLFSYEDNFAPPIRVYMSGIDSGAGKDNLGGSRTDAVYQWCSRDAMRRKPLKGESKPKIDTPVRHKKHTYTPPGVGRSPYEVWLHLFNSHYFNDLLSSAITAKLPSVNTETGELKADDGEDHWQLNSVVDEEYNTHLSNMTRKPVRVSGGKYEERWLPATSGARHDYRMCEVMSLVLAHGPAQCGGLPDPRVWDAMQKAKAQANAGVQYTNPLTSHKGKW